MNEDKTSKRPSALYGILALLSVFATFMILELTLFGDTADLNNSIILALSISSIIGLITMRKAGAAWATFSLTYIFSFNAFNVIYFPNTAILNGVSAILSAIGVVYMFKTIFSNRYK